MTAIIFKSALPETTYAYGEKLGFFLKPGDCICLSGDLGQGKTLLTKGIAAALNSADLVTSPTFSLLNIYTGQYQGENIDIYHFDLYRLDNEAQLEDIGFSEYVFGEGIALIEWPDKFIKSLPDSCLWLEITSAGLPEERQIKLTPHGKRYEDLCRELTL